MPGLSTRFRQALPPALEGAQPWLFGAFGLFMLVHYLVTPSVATQIAYYACLLPALLWHGWREKRHLREALAAMPLTAAFFAFLFLHALLFTPSGQYMGRIIGHTLNTALFVLAATVFFSFPLSAIHRFFHLLSLAALAGAAVSIALFLADPPPTGRLLPIGRAHHEVLGASVYGMAGLIAAYMAAQAQTQRHRLAYIATVLLVGALILLTKSRVPLLLYAASLAVLGFALYGRGWKQALLLFAFFAAACVAMLAIPALSELLARFTALADSASVGHRAELWTATLDQIRQSPWVGHGLLARIRITAHHIYAPHNLYLSTAYYLGIPALVLLLWMMVRSIRQAFSFRHTPYGVLVIVLVFYGALLCVTDHAQPVKGPSPLWLIFWMPLCMAWGQRLHSRIKN